MTEPTFSTISERIAWARTQAGVNPSALSIAAGLDRSHVRLIEDGGKRTAAETVGKIASVLGITTDWLISGAGDLPDVDALRAVGAILNSPRVPESDDPADPTLDEGRPSMVA